MARLYQQHDFDKLYLYYQEKTIKEKTFVLLSHSSFLNIIDKGFLAIEENEFSITGFILSHSKETSSYITMLYGDSLEIKKSLLDFYTHQMTKNEVKESLIHFFNPISLAWYPLEHITHPCYQGVPIHSEMHDFYLENGYISHSIQDTYYLDLKNFKMPEEILKLMKGNHNEGYDIAFYDPKVHLNIIEFTDKINAVHWKKVIMDNLQKDEPLPLLVALKNQEVIGFTGPLFVEETKRGYFAGIGVLETERGKKIGKTLFFMLCQALKDMGSSYMTLYTGRDNLARFIYLSAGFQVVKSFSTMKKIY